MADETLTLEHIKKAREAMRKQYHTYHPKLVVARYQVKAFSKMLGITEDEFLKGQNVDVIEGLPHVAE